MNRRNFIVAAIATAFTLAATASEQVIKIIVPFAPGGTTDLIARLIAPTLSVRLGQPVIVVNRPGAGGSVGTAEVAKAAPDGLTFGIATASAMAANPAMNPKIGYDPLVDFTPITNIAATPNVIAVHPSFGGRTFEQFLTTLRTQPGRYNYATSGVGSVGHLTMEHIQNLTKTTMTHVPFKGAGPAILSTVAAETEIIYDQLPSLRQQIFEGKLIAITIASTKRLPVPINMPTLAEEGYPTANRMAFYGLIGPAGMDAALVKKVHGAMEEVLFKDFGLRRKIEDTGSVVIGNTPSQFAAQLKDELEAAKAIVKKSGIKLD